MTSERSRSASAFRFKSLSADESLAADFAFNPSDHLERTGYQYDGRVLQTIERLRLRPGEPDVVEVSVRYAEVDKSDLEGSLARTITIRYDAEWVPAAVMGLMTVHSLWDGLRRKGDYTRSGKTSVASLSRELGEPWPPTKPETTTLTGTGDEIVDLGDLDSVSRDAASDRREALPAEVRRFERPYCLVREPDAYVLIPCGEIMRFYLAGSTTFAERMLTARSGRDLFADLIDTARSGFDGDTFYIYPKVPFMTKGAAMHLVMMYLSDDIRCLHDELALVARSARSSAAGAPIIARLPSAARKVKVQVEPHLLKRELHGRPVLIGQRIVQDRRVPPFERLIVGVESQPPYASGEDNPPEEPTKRRERKSRRRLAKNFRVRTDERPGTSTIRTDWYRDSVHARFPGLVRTDVVVKRAAKPMPPRETRSGEPKIVDEVGILPGQKGGTLDKLVQTPHAAEPRKNVDRSVREKRSFFADLETNPALMPSCMTIAVASMRPTLRAFCAAMYRLVVEYGFEIPTAGFSFDTRLVELYEMPTGLGRWALGVGGIRGRYVAVCRYERDGNCVYVLDFERARDQAIGPPISLVRPLGRAELGREELATIFRHVCRRAILPRSAPESLHGLGPIPTAAEFWDIRSRRMAHTDSRMANPAELADAIWQRTDDLLRAPSD